MNAIKESINYSSLTPTSPSAPSLNKEETKIQPAGQTQLNMKRIAGIALLAIAIILFIGALGASFGAAAGVLPLGIPIMQAFISAAPPVLVTALYLNQDNQPKIGVASDGKLSYTIDEANLNK